MLPALKDMILAYRKVKAELWWMKTVPSLLMLAEYERDLENNLSRLRSRLASSDFVPDGEFLGTVTYLPKKLVPNSAKTKDTIHYRVLSDSATTEKAGSEKWEELECRAMAIPSIDFQILGVLWTMGEGGRLDAKRPSSCRANVLRRNFIPDEDSNFPDTEGTLRGPVNKLYPGVFKPYFHAYKAWRNDGLERVRAAVENGQRVFALTLDLRRYYHQTDAYCLRTLFPPKSRIAKVFYEALEEWQDKYGEEPEKGERAGGAKLGIPVGLIASGLVANLILLPLDKAIEKRLSPIYYGRYVDDLFIALTLNGSFPTGESVLKELERLMPGDNRDEPRVKWHRPESSAGDDQGLLKFELKQWGDSRFESKASKQRLFLLKGMPGRDLLAVIDQDLKEHSSEWRMVPELDEDDDRWLKETLVASHDAAEGATTLRRADDLSIRRMGVAVTLRKLEAIEGFGLKPTEWNTHREAFYRVAATHLLSAEGLCDFWPKLPRLFGLTFANNDWSAANRLLTCIIEANAIFNRIPRKEQKNAPVLKTWLFQVIQDELFRACKSYPSQSEAKRFIRRFEDRFKVELRKLPDFADKIKEFRKRDLDREGLKLRARKTSRRNFARRIDKVKTFFQDTESEVFPQTSLYSMLFPTRPLGELEICLKHPKAAYSTRIMRECLYALRGQSLSGTVGKEGKDRGGGTRGKVKRICVSSEFPSQSIRVAVTNYKTSERSWLSRVRGSPDLSAERLNSLLLLLDEFLRTTKRHPWSERPLYFCLPELSVPREWLFSIAAYLSLARVSLIVGAEYECQDDSQPEALRNPAYLFLRNRDLGYPATYVFRQYKTKPAPAEEYTLWQESNLRLVGPKPTTLPVYVHGDFCFGVLLCSELTDAEIHHHFRCHVDALFCLEWNRDVDSFASLVESTSQTIHAFIVQVNNRLYGDSRIRAPSKERFRRDIIRLRGGIHNFFVVGELPINELRGFQRKTHSDLGERALYKPLPSGFDPKKTERLRSKSENE